MTWQNRDRSRAIRQTCLKAFLGIVYVLFVAQTSPTPDHARIDPVLHHFSGSKEVLIAFDDDIKWGEMHHLTKQQKGHYVYNTLVQRAYKDQAGVISYLQDQGVAYKSFCITNVIHTRLGSEQIARVGSQPGVVRITPNDMLMIEQPVETSENAQRSAIEWGLARIGADSVWAMGFAGQGVIVGGEDTGYDWRHPALTENYRGRHNDTADHNYHWHDAIHEISPLHQDSIVQPENNPCGLDVMEPCDDNGHGTHTMGTMIGHAGDDTIGVAPAAEWIACRNMERGYGSPATYIECFEWFLAPTDLNGDAPDPSMAPHVINNSWSCPPKEGCNPDNFHLIQTAITNLKAAGIVVVVSAGNEGPDCNTVNRPPGMHEESFVVGATNMRDTIARFSSRGSVMVDSSGRIKPDISAPGVNVRSAWLDSNYIFANGTSMAGPHVAGTVALMISANPQLAGQVEVIEDILESTAVQLETTQECDSIGPADVPNNTYGYGRLNALAAVRKAMTITRTRDVQQHNDLVVFPNPANDYLFLQADPQVTCHDVRIINYSGQVISTYGTGSCGERLYVGDIPPGLYFVHGVYGEEHFLARFVKL